jgi:cytochrome c5
MADDKTFLKRFSGIIFGLVIFTILIIVLAVSFKNPGSPEDNPSQLTLAAERIAPVAGVNTGDYEAPPAPATTEAEPAADTEAVAATGTEAAGAGPIDGEEIYNGGCAACHDAGVAGAPVPGGTMNERTEKGLDALVANAIDGINVMPPKGGNPSLTDEQVRAAVEFMMQ